jgi:hypothetical protein
LNQDYKTISESMKLHQAYLLIYLLVSPLSYLIFFSSTNFIISIGGLLMTLIIVACIIIQLADLVFWLMGNRIRRPFLPLLIIMGVFSGMFISEQHHRKQSNNNRQRANEIIVQIQKYIRQHEKAPEQLSVLTIERPETDYGFTVQPMEYSQSEDKEGNIRFKLSYINLYDHTKHTYDSREQQWSKAPVSLGFG